MFGYGRTHHKNPSTKTQAALQIMPGLDVIGTSVVTWVTQLKDLSCLPSVTNCGLENPKWLNFWHMIYPSNVNYLVLAMFHAHFQAIGPLFQRPLAHRWLLRVHSHGGHDFFHRAEKFHGRHWEFPPVLPWTVDGGERLAGGRWSGRSDTGQLDVEA